jgi:hypothetical protein
MHVWHEPPFGHAALQQMPSSHVPERQLTPTPAVHVLPAAPRATHAPPVAQ